MHRVFIYLRFWFTDCNYRKYVKDDNGDLDFYYGLYYDIWFRYSGEGGKLYCPGNGAKELSCEASTTLSDNRAASPILATDYKNYYLDYDCEEMFNFFGVFAMKNDYLMVYGRDKEMSDV